MGEGVNVKAKLSLQFSVDRSVQRSLSSPSSLLHCMVQRSYNQGRGRNLKRGVPLIAMSM